MKKIVIVGLIVLVLAVVFAGCFGDNSDGNDGSTDSRFIGEWEPEGGSGSLIFNSNGTVYAGIGSITEYVSN